MTDEPIHMPPPAVRPASTVTLAGAVPEPDEVPRVSVRLVGGPHHNTSITVRADRKVIELAYAVAPEPTDGPDMESDVDVRLAAEVAAVVCVYRRDNEDATTATFADYLLD